jgi:hypothetical protein
MVVLLLKKDDIQMVINIITYIYQNIFSLLFLKLSWLVFSEKEVVAFIDMSGGVRVGGLGRQDDMK